MEHHQSQREEKAAAAAVCCIDLRLKNTHVGNGWMSGFGCGCLVGCGYAMKQAVKTQPTCGVECGDCQIQIAIAIAVACHCDSEVTRSVFVSEGC